MYQWRQLSDVQRREVLRLRQQLELPQHSPAHRRSFGSGQWMLTAACYEHQPWIGVSPERMAEFEKELLEALRAADSDVIAWVILPNHYHALIQTEDISQSLAALGQLHGRTSFRWNAEDSQRGRKVWFRCAETLMKSDSHFWATMNYIHHNPVKHGYVEKWQDWPFGSASQFLSDAGTDEARAIWEAYPIQDYGKGWDD